MFACHFVVGQRGQLQLVRRRVKVCAGGAGGDGSFSRMDRNKVVAGFVPCSLLLVLVPFLSPSLSAEVSRLLPDTLSPYKAPVYDLSRLCVLYVTEEDYFSCW